MRFTLSFQISDGNGNFESDEMNFSELTPPVKEAMLKKIEGSLKVLEIGVENEPELSKEEEEQFG